MAYTRTLCAGINPTESRFFSGSGAPLAHCCTDTCMKVRVSVLQCRPIFLLIGFVLVAGLHSDGLLRGRHYKANFDARNKPAPQAEEGPHEISNDLADFHHLESRQFQASGQGHTSPERTPQCLSATTSRGGNLSKCDYDDNATRSLVQLLRTVESQGIEVLSYMCHSNQCSRSRPLYSNRSRSTMATAPWPVAGMGRGPAHLEQCAKWQPTPQPVPSGQAKGQRQRGQRQRGQGQAGQRQGCWKEGRGREGPLPSPSACSASDRGSSSLRKHASAAYRHDGGTATRRAHFSATGPEARASLYSTTGYGRDSTFVSRRGGQGTSPSREAADEGKAGTCQSQGPATRHHECLGTVPEGCHGDCDEADGRSAVGSAATRRCGGSVDDDAHRSQHGTEPTVRRQVERRGPGNRSRGQHHRDAHGYRGAEQETQSSGDRAAFTASGFLDGRVKDGRLHGASCQERGFQNPQTPAHNQRGDGHSFISGAGQGWRRAVQHGPSPRSAACNRRRLQAFCLGLWMSLNEGSHRPHFAEAPDMDWSLSGHSVMRESDYVSPITARCLALQLELTCCLQAHGPKSDHFWHDARIDVDDHDLSVCCPCGDLADQPSLPGTGATGHMDSLHGIEPCLDVRSFQLETAPVTSCRLDLSRQSICTVLSLYIVPLQVVHRGRTAPAPINTTSSIWGPLAHSDDPTELQASATVRPLIKKRFLSILSS